MVKEPIRIKGNMAQIVPMGWGTSEKVAVDANDMSVQQVPVLRKLVIERVHPDAVIPTYASEGDSGMDVYSPVNVLIRPQETVLVKAGIRMELPLHPFHEIGYRWEAQNRPRSGLSLKTEILPKFGTIDNTYRGEVGVILKNDAQIYFEVGLDVDREDGVIDSVRAEYEEVETGIVSDLQGNDVLWAELEAMGLVEWYDGGLPKGTLLVRKHDRIAQMVINQAIRPLEIVEGRVDTGTDRGVGGFGSTGIR